MTRSEKDAELLESLLAADRRVSDAKRSLDRARKDLDTATKERDRLKAELLGKPPAGVDKPGYGEDLPSVSSKELKLLKAMPAEDAIAARDLFKRARIDPKLGPNYLRSARKKEFIKKPADAKNGWYELTDLGRAARLGGVIKYTSRLRKSELQSLNGGNPRRKALVGTVP